VDHRPRQEFRSPHPAHITLRLVKGLPSLRQPRTHEVLKRALWWGSERFGLRIVHYVVLSNHIHLLAEARHARALERGVRGLAVRIARALNAHWDRSGRVIEHRFHARTLTTPLEAKNAIAYILLNARRHGLHVPDIDPYSSAAWFDGWKEDVSLPPGVIGWLPKPRTWLLTDGWKRHGRLDPWYLPKTKQSRA
jgi:REP element-mobilizing transposase RayT